MDKPFVQALHTMRIPSQFTADNLYRRPNRQRGPSDLRRLTHMVIALVLVLVLMQKASQPQIYQSFFGALTPAEESMSVPGSVTDRTFEPLATSERIDPAITAKVVDGTVWRSGDFDALHLFLDSANQLADRSGPVVGVLPLLQQPEIYLNRVVRSRGQVARSERIDAQSNEYGITEYWQLWIRPSDGADRPFVAIVPAVPERVAAVGANATEQTGPSVTVVGRFLKRLAYRSGAGADLAPVVVGRMTNFDSTAVAFVSPVSDQAEHGRVAVWLLFGLSAICGLSLAALAMWRTSVAATRTRQIRASRAESPKPFLQSLSAVASQDEKEL